MKKLLLLMFILFNAIIADTQIFLVEDYESADFYNNGGIITDTVSNISQIEISEYAIAFKGMVDGKQIGYSYTISDSGNIMYQLNGKLYYTYTIIDNNGIKIALYQMFNSITIIHNDTHKIEFFKLNLIN